MKPLGPRIQKLLVATAVLGALAFAYWRGYQAGFAAKGPDHRALMVVRRAKAQAGSAGASAIWFDVSKPLDALRMRREEARLKSIGAEYYVAKGVVETTINIEPFNRRIDSHQ